MSARTLVCSSCVLSMYQINNYHRSTIPCNVDILVRGVARIWEGGGKNLFFQIWKLTCREATCCAWLSHALC